MTSSDHVAPMVDRQLADTQIWPDSAFWRYSLDLYAWDGVEAACLALQERRSVDVNLVLFAFWLGGRGVALDQANADEIEGVIAGFRAETVQSLRTARRHLRKMQRASEPSSIAGRWPEQVERLRQCVAMLEIDGEHLIQLALEQACAGLKEGAPKGAALTAANLRMVAPFEETDRDDLAVLFHRAFDDVTEQGLELTFQKAGLFSRSG